MTTNPASAVAPPARWKIERVSDNQVDLIISTDLAAAPVRFPMGTEEAYGLVHGADRVLAWSASSAEGTFTQPVITPEQVRAHLEINGYVAAALDLDAHTRMVQATPWANWIEEVPAPDGFAVAWFVDVFAPDDPQFRQAAHAHGIRLDPSVYAGAQEPDGGR